MKSGPSRSRAFPGKATCESRSLMAGAPRPHKYTSSEVIKDPDDQITYSDEHCSWCAHPKKGTVSNG